MSAVMESVPLKLLNEFSEKKIQIDTKSGEMFKGTLVKDASGGPSVLEGMHINLKDVTATFASGHTAEMESVLIKGSRIRFICLPSEEAKEILDRLARSVRYAPRGRGRGGSRGGYRSRR